MCIRRTPSKRPFGNGWLVDASGGTFLFHSPGLQLQLVNVLSMHVYYQVPLIQDVNAVQLTSDSNLMVGLNYALSIGG